ncbi:hypothetical protein A2U01_0097080, partial [Trifolium medium]|nr:hypothetical protein [Trifolium medium]
MLMQAWLVAKNGLPRIISLSSAKPLSRITKSTGNAMSWTFTRTSSIMPCALIIDLFARSSSILLEIVILP